MAQTIPVDSAERKALPVTTGVIDYFPAAIAEIAKVSVYGNEKHNPGEDLHHARDKSTDHADSILRHLIDRGNIDPGTGVRHTAELAWRALALLQQELEDAGAPIARAARYKDPLDAILPPLRPGESTRLEEAQQRAAQPMRAAVNWAEQQADENLREQEAKAIEEIQEWEPPSDE